MEINLTMGLIILFQLDKLYDFYFLNLETMAKIKKSIACKDQIRLEAFSEKEFTLFIAFKKPNFDLSWPLTPGF